MLSAVGRALEKGAGAVTWENAGRLSANRYFARHSDAVDDFGFDPKWSAAVLPFFELLYALW